jgi:RimJ/RimL family protein N-acetyltransferase
MSFCYHAGRVNLRHLQLADLPAFASYRADATVARYQGFDPYSPSEAAAFIREHATAVIPALPGAWVQIGIARSADDLLLGDCALHLTRADPRMAEVGITVDPRWQGQGYAQEALRGLLRFCFQELKLHRVVALTDPRNLACVRLLEHAGMRREGHFIQNGWYKGEWCDEYQYALLGREWLNRY